MSSKSSKEVRGVGNTKTPRRQISPSSHWVFTLKFSDSSNSSIVSALDPIAEKYIFQREVGDSETKYEHWQGYVKFKKKTRPKGVLPESCHWEKCRSPKHSIAYCSKDETAYRPIQRFSKNIKIPRPLEKVTYEMLRPWQKEIADKYQEPAGMFDRKIHWYWEPEGGLGKSVLCKYFVDQKGAIIISGKGNDCLYAIQQYVEKNGEGPGIIIMDIPRSVGEYVSYNAIESAKNGCFFSGKYEGGMVRYNTPHILIFANEEPQAYKMSMDRWNIIQLSAALGIPNWPLPSP